MEAGPLARWRPLLYEPSSVHTQWELEQSAYVGVKFDLPHKGGRRLRLFGWGTEETFEPKRSQ